MWFTSMLPVRDNGASAIEGSLLHSVAAISVARIQYVWLASKLCSSKYRQFVHPKHKQL